MNIFTELTRIKGRGFNVVINWDYSIGFTKRHPKTSIHQRKQDGEMFEQTIYQAILRFDEKYPELA